MKYRERFLTAFLAVLFLLFVINVQAQLKSAGKRSKKENSPEQLQESEYIFTEGMKEYILENYSKALNAFEKSANLKKDNAAAYYMIAQIYMRQNNLYKSIQFAEKAVEIDETNKYYYLLLAQIYEKKQDFNEAARVYQNLIKKTPNAYEYYYNLAAVYLHIRKLDEAIKCFDKVEKFYGINEEITKQKQQIYLSMGKLNSAVEEGKRLIEEFPDESRYIISQVELLLSNDKTEEAEKLVEGLLKKEPNNPYANLALSDIYKNKGEKKKSEQKLEEAFKSPELDLDVKVGILVSKIRQIPTTEIQQPNEIKDQCLILGKILTNVHPQDAKSFAINGDILAISGKSNDALDSYLKSIKLDNTHFKIWQQITILDYELNKIDSLREHSEKALELFPNQSVLWLYNGISYQMQHKYKKAIVAFEEGKKLSSNDKNMMVQFNSNLGDSYNGLKEYKKSDDCFEEVLKEDANNHVVLNNYSYYLSLRKDKLEYARKMSEKVIKENPDNATYLDTYAWILYVMKEYVKAKDVFEKIVSTTTNGTIVEHYGDVLYQLDQQDKAVEFWKKAKQLGEATDLIDKKIADKKLYE